MIWATGYRPDYSWIDLPVVRRDRRSAPPRGRDRRARALLPRPHLAAHARLGADRLGQGRRRVHRRADRRPSAQTTARSTTAATQEREGSEQCTITHGHSADDSSSCRRTTRALPEATRPEVVELADGDEFELEIAPVAKRIGDATVRMLAYNGSIPGPTLKVPQGVDRDRPRHEPRRSRRHGALARAAAREPLRRNARHAGADPGRRDVHRTSQRSRTPAPTGTTRTSARTTARRWACTATSSSSPPTPTTGRPRTARLLLTLDDILIEDGKIAPFSESETTHVAMGRFGNVMLVAGEPDL